MTGARRRFLPLRWGMGDLLVLLSFGILLYFSFHPWELGVTAAQRELEATRKLKAWATSMSRMDLHEAFAEFVQDLLEDRQFQLVEKAETGIPLPFTPLVQDLDFQYGLSLPALGTGRGALWIAKERTGNKIWLSSRKGTGEPDRRQPRKRLARLSKVLGSSRAATLFPTYWKELMGTPGIHMVSTGILRGDHYFYVNSLLQERGRIALGIYAWPHKRGREGFAAFFFHPGLGMRQTRNMVHPYEGQESIPLPRAAVRRPSSKADHKGEYTGLDGNTWFPIEVTR